MPEKFKYKKVLLLFICNIVIISGNGQDIHYSNLNENFYKLNPAYITHFEHSSMQLNYRNQWPGSADFVTYSGAFFYNSETLKSTAGIQILRDDQGRGIINTTGFSLLYGYRTSLFHDISFAAGINGGYNIYTVDFSKLQFENNQIPSLNSRRNYFDFSAGVELGFMKRSYFGLSVAHLSTPDLSPGNPIARKYCISYQGDYNLSKQYSHQQISVEPLLVTTFQKDINEILYGTRIDYSNILGGIYVRQDYNFNFDAIIILLGISFGNNMFIYTYDINLSGAGSNFYKLAAHEVTFLHKFEYTKTRNKKGAIKCPKF
jgi:type IX secretion system PorP/SprF family membrane protein